MYRTAANKGATGRKGAEFRESHPNGHDDRLSKMPGRLPVMAFDVLAMSQESAEQTVKCNRVNYEKIGNFGKTSWLGGGEMVNVLFRDGIECLAHANDDRIGSNRRESDRPFSPTTAALCQTQHSE
ncbi:hypothetical protein [uncultured Sphingomonas sp.]|uniref:hypothetical protein n=1 Tax=uncultured Sphingomonas sp. TaxID=158754 RepID=UPI0025D32B72|nr:hypothetical protein [uncultured Sphingomonas sp.]